jgi:hypothetical protein
MRVPVDPYAQHKQTQHIKIPRQSRDPREASMSSDVEMEAADGGDAGSDSGSGGASEDGGVVRIVLPAAAVRGASCAAAQRRGGAGGGGGGGGGGGEEAGGGGDGDVFSGMTVKQLKDELRERGVACDGARARTSLAWRARGHRGPPPIAP